MIAEHFELGERLFDRWILPKDRFKPFEHSDLPLRAGATGASGDTPVIYGFDHPQGIEVSAYEIPGSP